jgi:hypothetical protein
LPIQLSRWRLHTQDAALFLASLCRRRLAFMQFVGVGVTEPDILVQRNSTDLRASIWMPQTIIPLVNSADRARLAATVKDRNRPHRSGLGLRRAKGWH